MSSSINYLGFLFDGKNIKIRPRAITKYYYRMRRKARTIGRSNKVKWTELSLEATEMNPIPLHESAETA